MPEPGPIVGLAGGNKTKEAKLVATIVIAVLCSASKAVSSGLAQVGSPQMEVVSCAPARLLCAVASFSWKAALCATLFGLPLSPICSQDPTPPLTGLPKPAHIFMNRPSLISIIADFSVPAVFSQGPEHPCVLGLVTVLICISNRFDEIQPHTIEF